MAKLPFIRLLKPFLAAAIVCVAAVAPADNAAPTIIRNVLIAGTRAPAYYSVVDGGYRPIQRSVLTADNLAP